MLMRGARTRLMRGALLAALALGAAWLMGDLVYTAMDGGAPRG
jgi:hypothetical protein